MTDIYTLDGFGVRYNLKNFGGVPFQSPNVIRRLEYDNNLSALLTPRIALKKTAEVVEEIDRIAHLPDYKEFWGHSMGGEMLEAWLRNKGPRSDVDPASVKFHISGSPENRMGGVCHIRPRKHPAAYGGLSVPEDTPYDVTYIIRQYDYYADHPRDLENKLAVENVDTGHIHSEYSKCRLDDDANEVHIRGNITYIFCPTSIMPLAKKWRFFGITSLQRREDAKLRPIVVYAYDRTQLL